MIPDVATVEGLEITVPPTGTGLKWISNFVGSPQGGPAGGPVWGTSGGPSQKFGTASVVGLSPCGKVTVWGSLIVLVTHSIVSPALTDVFWGSISAISTNGVAVPAVTVTVWVPSGLSWTGADGTATSAARASSVSLLA